MSLVTSKEQNQYLEKDYTIRTGNTYLISTVMIVLINNLTGMVCCICLIRTKLHRQHIVIVALENVFCCSADTVAEFCPLWTKDAEPIFVLRSAGMEF